MNLVGVNMYNYDEGILNVQIGTIRFLKDNKELTNFISNLREKLNEFFEISDARRLHITLAKSNELISKQECICDLKIPNDCNFENIAIGLSGKNGILENTIKKFKINNQI